MSSGVVALVLLAALCHATWNAFVKAADDRVAGLAAINLVGAAFGALLLPWVALPGPALRRLLAASVLVHLLYKLLLPLTYRAGDLSRAYPVIRGVAPLLAGAIAALVLGERLSALEAGGMAGICLGILALSAERGWPRIAELRALLLAGLTGGAIAVYTVIDGVGARHAPSPFAFAAWLFLLDGTTFVVAARFWRGPALWATLRDGRRAGLASGLVAVGSYGVFLWALSLGAIGTVAALRETSVLFATLIGGLFLRERLGLVRFGAAGLITLGIILIAEER